MDYFIEISSVTYQRKRVISVISFTYTTAIIGHKPCLLPFKALKAVWKYASKFCPVIMFFKDLPLSFSLVRTPTSFLDVDTDTWHAD
jgi:hypothetical protein